MGNIIETGEFTVSGNGSLKIKLQGRPVRVVCDFVDVNLPPLSCNIPFDDKLEYTVISQRALIRRQYFLVVEYSVSSIRTVKWRSHE